MAIFSSYVKLPEGSSESHQIPLNHHFPLVFLWFTSVFPEGSGESYRSSPVSLGAACDGSRADRLLQVQVLMMTLLVQVRVPGFNYKGLA